MMKIFLDNCTGLPSARFLLKLISNAHDACALENMSCPWCSGHIGYTSSSGYEGSDGMPVLDEQHDEFCPWPALKSLESEWQSQTLPT